MVTARKPLALICEDDAVVAAALVDTANGLFGFEVVAPVASGREAVELSSTVQPDLVVIDVALFGERGLGTISALLDAAPGCAVIVVAQAPFASLRAAAIEAGAMALVELSDLRQLRAHLRQVSAAVKDPLACPTRTPVGAPSTATGINVSHRKAGGSSSSAPI